MIKTRIEEGLDSLIEMYTIEIEDDTECLKKHKALLKEQKKQNEELFKTLEWIFSKDNKEEK